MKINHNNFLKLAFENAKVNLGKTRTNPSVGCVVVKNNSVISSGTTSILGRPHAEVNALKINKDFKNSDIYLTMEPCTHYGVTPPCTKLIIKKKIKRVFYSFYDLDYRTAKLSKKRLKEKNIKVYKKKIKKFDSFYQSYFVNRKNFAPLIDAKIAVSKDYYTIKQNSKWITNVYSRRRVHFIRSEYDGIVSTSKTINSDNAQLNCRLKGFEKKSPDLFIIDMNLKIKKNLKIFKNNFNRKIFLITSIKNKKKENFFKKLDIKIIYIDKLNSKNDFIKLFKIIKDLGYNRLLVESGLVFLNSLLKHKLIFNIFIFKSSLLLFKKGSNNTTNSYIKRLKLNNKIKVNLNEDKLYKVKIKNV